MPRPYATAEQIKTLVDITVSDGSITMTRAFADVDRILRGARYATDGDGNPTHPELIDLLVTMTAEQIAWYAELGDETGIVTATTGGRIGNVSLPSVASGASGQGTGLLSPRANDLARNHPLLDWTVRY